MQVTDADVVSGKVFHQGNDGGRLAAGFNFVEGILIFVNSIDDTFIADELPQGCGEEAISGAEVGPYLVWCQGVNTRFDERRGSSKFQGIRNKGSNLTGSGGESKRKRI